MDICAFVVLAYKRACVCVRCVCVCVFLCAHKLYILSKFVLIFTQPLGASEILLSSKDCLLFTHACKDPNEKGTEKCWEDNSTKTYHETHD